MFDISFIGGLNFGLEYFDSDALGFGCILSLGLIRVYWYRDLVEVTEDEEQ